MELLTKDLTEQIKAAHQSLWTNDGQYVLQDTIRDAIPGKPTGSTLAFILRGLGAKRSNWNKAYRWKPTDKTAPK